MKKVYLFFMMVVAFGLAGAVQAQTLSGGSTGCGTVTDADGTTYQTVLIGSDCWMAENLRTSVEGASYYLDDDANEPFGRLYTWAAAVGVNSTEQTASDGTTYIQGVCPAGWAIPTAAQFNTMLAAAGGDADAVKSADANAWLPGEAGTNASGFGAMGAGYYDADQYQRKLGYTYFWTSELGTSSSLVAKVMELRCGCGEFICMDRSKDNKLSVRCVRVEAAPATFTCGTDKMKDADNNEYETVLIGTQCWTKTNLRVAPAGATKGTTPGTSSNTDPYYYVNTAVDASTYGYYYNWAAAKLACPSGWHLPSDAEWTAMEATQTSAVLNSIGYRGDHAGKLAGDGWKSSTAAGAPGNAGDAHHNASGFSAVSAGYRSGSSFYNAGDEAYFWSSTENSYYYAYYRTLYYNSPSVGRNYYFKTYGLSVRCLRDSE